MADSYDRYDSEGAGAGFMMGLLTGTVLGAGLGMLLAPKAGSELRGVIGEQARNMGSRASEEYRKASSAAGTWAEKGREFVDRTRESAGRAAEESGFTTSGSSGSAFGAAGSSSGSSFGSTSSSSGIDNNRS